VSGSLHFAVRAGIIGRGHDRWAHPERHPFNGPLGINFAISRHRSLQALRRSLSVQRRRRPIDPQGREKDMQHNRGSTLSRDVRRGSRPAAREQEKKIANAIQADESKAQRCCCADSASPDLWARSVAKSSRKPARFHAASDLKIGDSAMDQNRNSESVHRAGHRERLTTYRTFRRSAISSNFAWLAANPFT
jgi:hypothetical protein